MPGPGLAPALDRPSTPAAARQNSAASSAGPRDLIGEPPFQGMPHAPLEGVSRAVPSECQISRHDRDLQRPAAQGEDGEAMTEIRFGRQVCGNLAEESAREWLVADSVGGYAKGTVGGLRIRRYHGLLMVATDPPRGRRLALASLDPVIVLGDNPVRLAVHEWTGSVVAPQGHLLLEWFALRDGVPTWRWQIEDVVVERELAMAHGRAAVGVVMRVIRAPGPVRVELEALGTWRDAHTERFGNWEPVVDRLDDGYVFERRYRVRGPGFDPAGAAWYRGVSHREEAARGLSDHEYLFSGWRFGWYLGPGETLEVGSWTCPDLTESAAPPPATALVQAARDAVELAARAEPRDEVDRHLAMAADQFVVAG